MRNFGAPSLPKEERPQPTTSSTIATIATIPTIATTIEQVLCLLQLPHRKHLLLPGGGLRKVLPVGVLPTSTGHLLL